jgi:predicted PurR-regulated permease PerM
MVNQRSSASGLLTLAALVVTIAALHLAREIFLPIALAVLLSFLLAPLADRVERLGLGRVPSTLIVVAVTFLLLGGLGWIVTSQVIDLSFKLPTYMANVERKVDAITKDSQVIKRLTSAFEEMQEKTASARTKGKVKAAVPSLSSSDRSDWMTWLSARVVDRNQPDEQSVTVRVQAVPESPWRQVLNWLGPLLSPLVTSGLVVVLVIFMLLRREDHRNRVIRLFGSQHLHATTEAISDIVERVSRYLRMQFLINLSYGTLVAIGLGLIGVPNAVMWGVMSFALRFRPYVGPWISAIMPLAVSAGYFPSWTPSLLVVGWFVILELVVNNVAEPLLYGSSTGVSGLGIIMAALFWTWLWGPIGLILAVPLTVCVVVMARYIPGLRFVAVLLGDEPTLSLEERIYQRMLAFDEEEVQQLAIDALGDGEPAKFYDDILLPALRLAEKDRQTGLLNEEQEQFVLEAARDLVGDLGRLVATKQGDGAARAREAQIEGGPRLPAVRVLSVPLREDADEASSLMLQQLLEVEGLEIITGAARSLTGELVASVKELRIDVVIISILPPLPARDSRLLCSRLRSAYPTLPILVGYWSGVEPKNLRRRLGAGADAEIYTTLADAVLRTKAIAARLRVAGAQPTLEEGEIEGAKIVSARTA